ncbi:MAG TPA: hypothetical protein VH591_18405 [Ktedonobacterales bacterium]|jgi:hypothetical protein
MAGEPARARRFRLPPGEWARQHIVQLVTLGVIVAVLFACCNPPAWPTVVWQVVAHDCGKVQWSGFAGGASSDATQAETCFVHAYQHCSAATLSASFVNLDVSASYSFVIEPYGFTCAVGALWNRGSRAPFGIGNGPGIGYCGSVRLEADGLRILGCQFLGDVLVPGGV